MPYLGNSPQNNIRQRYYYTATGGQTLFTGADDNGTVLKYQDNKYLDVYLNGVLLQDTIDYTALTKSSVTLLSGATAGDLVEIVAYGVFSVADTVSASLGGTFSGNVDFTQSVAITGNLKTGGTNSANGIFIGRNNRYASVELVGPDSAGGLIDFTMPNEDFRGRIVYFNTANTMNFLTAGQYRMTIDGAGSVGIGTTSPQKQFVVSNGGAGGLEISPLGRSNETGTSLLSYNRATSAFIPAQYDANTHQFMIGTVERMRIDSSGRVLIGTTSAASGYVLQPYGKIYAGDDTDVTPDAFWSGQLTIRGNGYSGGLSLNATGMWVGHNSSARALIFATDETERIRIDNIGQIYHYATQLNVYPGTGNKYEFVNRSATGGFDFYVNSGGTLASTIDSTGRYKMPYQPSFMAVGAGYGSQYFTDKSIGNYVTGYGGHNVGGHFSTGSSGGTLRFTAPVTGYYFFTAGVLYYGGATTTPSIISIRLNGNTIASNYRDGATQNHVMTVSVIAYLVANDWVDASAQSTNASAFYDNAATTGQYGSSNYNFFSGRLLG